MPLVNAYYIGLDIETLILLLHFFNLLQLASHLVIESLNAVIHLVLNLIELMNALVDPSAFNSSSTE